jgi:hypothetical protein
MYVAGVTSHRENIDAICATLASSGNSLTAWLIPITIGHCDPATISLVYSWFLSTRTAHCWRRIVLHTAIHQQGGTQWIKDRSKASVG